MYFLVVAPPILTSLLYVLMKQSIVVIGSRNLRKIIRTKQSPKFPEIPEIPIEYNDSNKCFVKYKLTHSQYIN